MAVGIWVGVEVGIKLGVTVGLGVNVAVGVGVSVARNGRLATPQDILVSARIIIKTIKRCRLLLLNMAGLLVKKSLPAIKAERELVHDFPLCNLREHVGKIGVLQSCYQFILRVTPNRFDRTIFIKRARPTIANALIQLDGTVNCLDHIQQCDVLRVTRKGHSTTRAA